jgi:hypothetical protein
VVPHSKKLQPSSIARHHRDKSYGDKCVFHRGEHIRQGYRYSRGVPVVPRGRPHHRDKCGFLKCVFFHLLSFGDPLNLFFHRDKCVFLKCVFFHHDKSYGDKSYGDKSYGDKCVFSKCFG